MMAMLPILLFAETNSSIEEFDNIEVEGSVYIQNQDFLKNAPMQKQISIQEAMDIPGTNGDPLKALKSLAGIVSTDNDGAEMIIHGSKPRETNFSINHLPLGYVFHMGGLHSVIAPEATKQIDAYLGGFDVSYNGMGAAIDITPQYPVGKNGGRVHIGMYDADFALDIALTNDISMFVSARRSYFDLIAAKVMDELYVDKDDSNKSVDFTLFPQYYDANFILSANLDDHLLSLEIITSKDEMKLGSTMGGKSDPDANGKIERSLEFTTVGARWIYYGSDYTSNTLLYQMQLKYRLDLFEDMYADVKNTSRGLHHYTSFDFDKHKPKVGFEVININSPINAYIVAVSQSDDVPKTITGSEVISLKETFDTNVYIFYVQDIYSISDDFRIRYGVRGGKIDYGDFGKYLDPRGAIIYDISSDSVVAFSAGKYSQMPKDEVAVDGFGNPEINTMEVSNHYAFSFKHAFGKKSYIEVEPYYKNFKNLAIADDTKKYLSVGEGWVKGIDITLKKDIDNLKLMVAYTYLDSKRDLHTSADRMYDFYGEIPHTLQLSSSYKFKSDWKVSALFKYSSGKLYTPIYGGIETTNDEGTAYIEPISGDPFSKRLSDIYDLDIKISKTYKTSPKTSHEISIELMNLTSLFRDNIAGIKYDDYYNKNGYYYQMGFIPAFHYTYRF